MTTGKGTASLFAPFALCEHWSAPSEASYQQDRWKQVSPDDLSEGGVLYSPLHHPHWIIQCRSADLGWTNHSGAISSCSQYQGNISALGWGGSSVACLQYKGVLVSRRRSLMWQGGIWYFLHARVQYHRAWPSWVATAGWTGLLPSKLSILPSHPAFGSGANSKMAQGSRHWIWWSRCTSFSFSYLKKCIHC